PVAELYYGTYKLKAKDVELPKEKITEAKELEIKGKGNFCGSIKEVFTPISKADLKKSTLKITLSAKTVVFNGMEQRPEVTVTASDGTKLEETTDYVVSYSHNCNAGKAAVVVEGRGKYYGGASATFTIKPDTTSVIAVKSEGKVLHNPAGATVSLLVTAGDRILTEGIDYTVKYSNNKKVGTGQALISFIGNYKGQKAKKQSFTIEAAPFLWAEFFVGSMTYTKPGKFFSKVYVTDGDVQLKEKKDYTVAYYTDEACTNALPAKYTMEEGKSQVVLYAKITGAGNYKSDSSKVVSFALYRAGEGKIDLSKARIVDPATGKKLGKQEYTGRAVTPAIKVQVKVGKTWTDVDPSAYNIVYSNNVEKGKATVVVSGKGTAATGSKAAVFAIKAKDMKGFEQGKFGEK
ncbi:MAG: hypothetical protein K6E50_03970, partial [Lachnospiraceae bacterium]|nr:hypothetical protein [Lachnospiraceae bacterium]